MDEQATRRAGEAPKKTGQGNESSVHCKFEVPNNLGVYTSLEFSKMVRLEV